MIVYCSSFLDTKCKRSFLFLNSSNNYFQAYHSENDRVIKAGESNLFREAGMIKSNEVDQTDLCYDEVVKRKDINQFDLSEEHGVIKDHEN